MTWFEILLFYPLSCDLQNLGFLFVWHIGFDFSVNIDVKRRNNVERKLFRQKYLRIFQKFVPLTFQVKRFRKHCDKATVLIKKAFCAYDVFVAEHQSAYVLFCGYVLLRRWLNCGFCKNCHTEIICQIFIFITYFQKIVFGLDKAAY